MPSHRSHVSLARLSEAVEYARRAHGAQVRTATRIPYLGHLLGVAALVIEDGGSETDAIAALLHDAAEDAGGAARLADIRRRFGAGIAEMVRECTDTMARPKPAWRARKTAYLAHLDTVGLPAVRVIAADKLYNARAILRDYQEIGDRVWARFQGGKSGTTWYYQSLRDILTRTYPGPLTRELGRVVGTLTRLVDTADHPP